MTTVTSPLAGRAIGLAAVPDPVFSGAMVGPGTAIDPVREPSRGGLSRRRCRRLPAPARLRRRRRRGARRAHPPRASTPSSSTARASSCSSNKGDTVARGQAVVRWNPAAVEAAGQVPDLPRRGAGGHGRLPRRAAEDGDVKAGDTLFSWQ